MPNKSRIDLQLTLTLSVIGLSLILQCCCIGAKENYLGNNIYLSEYDNVDRRILYQRESCAKSGVGIVPMSVNAIAYNTEWIIAKSDSRYWIIKNKYDDTPDAETVKRNTIEFEDYESFLTYLEEHNIKLELKELN